MRHESIAPEAFTNDQLVIAISQHTHAAKGVGRQLAQEPEEAGWTPDSPFDHDGFQSLTDAAVEAAQHHAKINKLFYNQEKLADNVLDLMAQACWAGWDSQKRMIKALKQIAAPIMVPLDLTPDRDQPNAWRDRACERADIARTVVDSEGLADMQWDENGENPQPA